MSRELVGGKGYSRGQEKDWKVNLEEDMSVLGMKFEGWQKAVQKAGIWFRRVKEGAEYPCGNGMARRDADMQRDTQRPLQRHPPSASLSGRREGNVGGGRGGRPAQETEVWIRSSSS